MPWAPDALRKIESLAQFHQAIETHESVWEKHCMVVPSTTNSENYSFPGFLPTPRLFLDERQFQGARDFTFDLANNEYELSMIILRKHWEDDQKGLIKARIAEMAQVWATFHDSLFADLLAAGNVSGSNGFDGATFHQASRTIGDSGNFDNDLSRAAATGTVFVVAEALDAVEEARVLFMGANDDQGRPFNSAALSELRVIVPPIQERAFYEVQNQTLIGGGNTNAYSAFLTGLDVLPYLSSGVEIYFSALGSTRKPFIKQERMPFEVIILDGLNDVVENNGVKVLCRERFVFGYGEPRRSALMTIT